MHLEDTQRLVTEIEMLKVVLYLLIVRAAATITLADYIYMRI